MKDVYEKTPQMGDPASLEPQITETLRNIERLKLEVQKYEVRGRPWRGRPAESPREAGGRGPGGRRQGRGGPQLFPIMALGVQGDLREPLGPEPVTWWRPGPELMS